ncbi:baseplate J/gp47 family protein [Bacillus cereus group sp. BfR-BA-01700]|uniref:baseplate J/gp47 family protein n=1 Tax=Bacillus cereus group sp. BfR-BA-01700 TaxID=3094884 RepID=UPI0029C33D7A|nr:baseplate J/gp47 family protein [Bacillus cereus group sp. BfR-BA-01700]MDX5840159.1 baseplate J/gp47 family protein [Bacillus cereus group sp. BfR-BA-01700]
MSYPAWWNETEDDVMSRLLSKVDKKWDRRQGGFIYDVLKPLAIERSEGRKEFKSWYNNFFAQYAKGEHLDVIVQSRTPYTRYSPKKARGRVTVNGNKGTKLSKGSIYVAVRYELDKKIIEYRQLEDAVIGDSESATVEIECSIPGIIGNTGVGTIELMESVFGVSNVMNEYRITGGEEAESDEDFASRYFIWLRESSNSGNIGDYIRWALSVTNVGGVLVFPVANGKGTVKLMVCDSSFEPAPTHLIQQIQNYINPTIEMGDGKSPIGASVIIVPATPVKINMNIKLSTNDNTQINKQNLIANVNKYLKQCNKAYWRDDANRQSILKEQYTISFLKIGAIAVDTFPTAARVEMTINGQMKDVIINSGQTAIIGEVTVNGSA